MPCHCPLVGCEFHNCHKWSPTDTKSNPPPPSRSTCLSKGRLFVFHNSCICISICVDVCEEVEEVHVHNQIEPNRERTQTLGAHKSADVNGRKPTVRRRNTKRNFRANGDGDVDAGADTKIQITFGSESERSAGEHRNMFEAQTSAPTVFDRSPLGTTNPIWKLVSLLVGTGISINKSRLPHHRVDQNATASLRTWLIWVLSPPPPLYPSGLLVMFMPHDLFFICRHIFFPLLGPQS
uniref:HDC12579 n=1 Tax=Drosophila melanogaster TaxID=7227 RepID=Q6IKF4_DROME|nr:TPA_inf: HDC12579 [Drosophila melanogaster]